MIQLDFELTGVNDLLMHADDVERADELSAHRASMKKAEKVAGDDRSPAWSWQTYLYHDGTHIVMPSQNIKRALMYGGVMVSLKGNKTFKEASQSGIVIPVDYCDFLVNGKQIPVQPIFDCMNEKFTEQKAVCERLGFSLDVRRAKVGSSKHVRVRPKFSNWSVRGHARIVDADLFTSETGSTCDRAIEIFELSGNGGLCDWRPSSKQSPGSFGIYQASVNVSA